MAKNSPDRPTEPNAGRPDRRAKLADLQKTQKARERRTVLLIVSACAALVPILGGVITYSVIDGRSKTPASSILSLGVRSVLAS